MVLKTPWHIFYKCFQNQATSEEKAKLSSWLGESMENIQMLEEVYNIYSISSVLPSPLNPDTQKAWQHVNQKISAKNRFRKRLPSRLKYAVAIAAVVVLCLIIYSVINNYFRKNQLSQQYTEIVTPMGQKVTVMLPDSSSVWLNSGSSLKYARDFNSREREVILKGEAFFEIKKDKSKRFRVKSGSLNVDVYGTSFNVKNYSDDNIQEVTVAEGIVGLSDRSKEIHRLTKGDQAILNKEQGKVIYTKGDPDLVTSWKNNELIFRNTPIQEVVKYLERWYGVNITIDDAMKNEHNYTFKVKTESFREILDMMKIMTPFRYQVNGKDVKIMYNK